MGTRSHVWRIRRGLRTAPECSVVLLVVRYGGGDGRAIRRDCSPAHGAPGVRVRVRISALLPGQVPVLAPGQVPADAVSRVRRQDRRGATAGGGRPTGEGRGRGGAPVRNTDRNY